MALRKAGAYTRMKVSAYTRHSKLKGKSYIKTVPPQNIVKFAMGANNLYQAGKLPHQITVVATEYAQIRHNALEACRQYINKRLDLEVTGQYYFKVLPYPHHIQRENKMLTGAGADRMSSGMQLSFGKPMGKAALVKNGTGIYFFALANDKGVRIVRDILNRIRPKMPSRMKVLYEFKKPAVVKAK